MSDEDRLQVWKSYVEDVANAQRHREASLSLAREEAVHARIQDNRRLNWDHKVPRQRRDFIRFAAVHNAAHGHDVREAVNRAERLWEELARQGHCLHASELEDPGNDEEWNRRKPEKEG